MFYSTKFIFDTDFVPLQDFTVIKYTKNFPVVASTLMGSNQAINKSFDSPEHDQKSIRPEKVHNMLATQVPGYVICSAIIILPFKIARTPNIWHSRQN